MANDPAPSTPASTPAHAFRTYAQDLAALGGKAAALSAQKPVPAPAKKPEPVREPVKAPAPKPPEPTPPPAYIIPKAPTTSETREEVLARLKKKIEVARPAASAAASQAPTRPARVPEAMSAHIIPKAPSTNESRETVLARLKATAGIATPSVPATAPRPMPLPKKPEPLAPPAPIHTYTSDFADHIDAKGASTFSVLAAQADAGQGTTARIPTKQRFPIALTAGIVLILLGGSGIYAAYRVVSNHPVVPVSIVVPSLIHADEKEKLSGSGAELMQALASAASEPLTEGAVRVTYVTQSTTTPDGTPVENPSQGGALIAALRVPAPDILLRSIAPESTVGILNIGNEARAFFILRVSSFERSFAGMLDWEPRMQNDLSLLYPRYIYPTENIRTSTASTTPKDATPVATSTTPTIDRSLPLPTFADKVVANHNVRILLDTGGRPLLIYGYADKETLVIARDEAAFSELLQRLQAAH